MNLILDKLAQAVLVHINAPRLSVVNLALDHRRIGSGLNLEARYSVVMNVVFLKVTLRKNTQQKAPFSTCQTVIPFHKSK